MRIEGAHTFAATRAMIWSLLHDPVMISQAIPGCDTFEQISPSEYMGSLTIKKGPFSGEYKGTLKVSDKVHNEAYSLTLNGAGLEGSIWAEGHMTLKERNGNTTVIYEGEIVAGGSTVTASPRLLRTTANSLIRQFLTEIERHIQIQTGTYTTQIPTRPTDTRRTSRVDVRDKIQEIKQNRRTTAIVIILLLLAAFMTIGAAVIAILFIRFGLRLFRSYVKRVVHEERQNQPLN